MTQDADELVEHLGVDGRDPDVQAAAAAVLCASAARDMGKLLHAITEFDATVRRVGGRWIVKPV